MRSNVGLCTRRGLLLGAAATLTVPLHAADPPPIPPGGRPWRIGWLGTATAAGYVREVESVRAGLRELGYVEGRNLQIEFRWAEGSPQRLGALAAELVALGPDVILTHSLAGVRAAIAATRTVPVVMMDGPDLADVGLVASLAKPGGNLTGSTSFVLEVAGKRLEVLKEVVPQIERVAVIVNERSTLLAVLWREMQAAAQKLKLRLQTFGVRAPADLPAAFEAAAGAGMDAAVIHDDPLLNANAAAVATLAMAKRLPAVGYANFADVGGLLAYGSNRAAVYARSATFVDRILKGANPGDLPIERASRFDLVVNSNTASALGITISPVVLLRATRVIE